MLALTPMGGRSFGAESAPQSVELDQGCSSRAIVHCLIEVDRQQKLVDHGWPFVEGNCGRGARFDRNALTVSRHLQMVNRFSNVGFGVGNDREW